MVWRVRTRSLAASMKRRRPGSGDKARRTQEACEGSWSLPVEPKTLGESAHSAARIEPRQPARLCLGILIAHVGCRRKGQLPEEFHFAGQFLKCHKIHPLLTKLAGAEIESGTFVCRQFSQSGGHKTWRAGFGTA